MRQLEDFFVLSLYLDRLSRFVKVGCKEAEITVSCNIRTTETKINLSRTPHESVDPLAVAQAAAVSNFTQLPGK